MIRIAIVEDEEDYQIQLQKYIHDYEKDNEDKFEIYTFPDGDDILYNYAAIYDIILMDIQMKHLDGMHTAKEIRKLDENVDIIFITSMSQYAIQGYEVGALSYVLKQISYFAFSQELDKAVKRLKKRNNHYICIMQDQGMLRLNVSEITYVESQNHNMVVHSEKGIYSFRGKMKDMEKKLSLDNFFRCNNGYLVNLRHVETIQLNEVSVAGDLLQISRAKKKAFLEALADYFGGNG